VATETLELIARNIGRGRDDRPSMFMVAHTAYLIFGGSSDRAGPSLDRPRKREEFKPGRERAERYP